ncbi:GNAT family N-acetyltransferase [[Mycoplasma] testudinis]|uniref:GNAT family N-acetyltransferase n=1 Tax=[Mycoplasma] testudinis TaxID=33924 RepID=UPI0004896898|nr:GNAT family protein [[Mycoplasma] testudinis]
MFREYYQINSFYGLRKIDWRDFNEIYKLTKSNLKFLPFLKWAKNNNYSEANAFQNIATNLIQWQENKAWNYEILRLDKIIGRFEIRTTKILDSVELGYWIDLKHRLQGITKTIINFIFQQCRILNVKSIVVVINPQNIPAINLAKSLGFTLFNSPSNPYNEASNMATFIKYL